MRNFQQEISEDTNCKCNPFLVICHRNFPEKIVSRFVSKIWQKIQSYAIYPPRGRRTDPVDQAPIRLVAVGCDEYVAEADYC